MLVSRESPQLNSLVVGPRCHHFVCWVESDPVDSLLVAFDNVFDFDLGASENLVGAGSLFLHAFLLQTREVPNSDSLI